MVAIGSIILYNVKRQVKLDIGLANVLMMDPISMTIVIEVYSDLRRRD